MRALRLAPAATTIAAAWIASVGVGALLLESLGGKVDLAGAFAAGPPNERPDGREAAAFPVSREDLLAGNLFDLPPEPTAGRVAALPAPGDPPALPGDEPRTAAAQCRLPLRVVVLVVVQAAGADRSLAVLERNGRAEEHRVGDVIDGAELVRLGRDGAFFRPPDEPGECFVDLRRAAPAAEEAGRRLPPEGVDRGRDGGPARPLPVPDTPLQRFRDALAGGVQAVGETEYVVDRSIARTAFDRPELAADGVRVVPYERDGKVVGFRVLGVRPDSLAGRLGLRDGDVVATVNGVALDGLDGAVRALGVIRLAERIDVTVLRRGSRSTMSYRLR
jgi:general secretion pathway protein C